MAPSMDAAITSRTPAPKNQTDARTTGTSVATTDHMILAVESWACRCGDAMSRSLCSARGHPLPTAPPNPSRATPSCDHLLLPRLLRRPLGLLLLPFLLRLLLLRPLLRAPQPAFPSANICDSGMLDGQT
jgi:hypothetical protein